MLEILGEILTRAQADLDRAGVRYALIGGLAIGARTVLRFAQDADLTVAIKTGAEGKHLQGVYQGFWRSGRAIENLFG